MEEMNEETKIECYQCKQHKPITEIFSYCLECASEIERTNEGRCPFCARGAKFLCLSCHVETHGKAWARANFKNL